MVLLGVVGLFCVIDLMCDGWSRQLMLDEPRAWCEKAMWRWSLAGRLLHRVYSGILLYIQQGPFNRLP